jgi:catechol 2,3-dioxygenase-like lactoylglutathione lyase family enzyme
VKIHNITFDCADPDALSAFWAQALGYAKRALPPDMRAELLAAGLTEEDLRARGLAEDPQGGGPRLLFQRVPEPKTAKNRMHMDILAVPGRRATTEEVDAEVERLQGLGATVLRKSDGSWGPYPEYHYVMADPEGNEFCVQ